MTKYGIERMLDVGRKSGIIGAAALTALVLGMLAGSIGSLGTAQAAENVEELTLEEIVDIVQAKGFGTVYEVERERGEFEVKVRDAEGVRSKLYVDSMTGEVLHQNPIDDDDGDERDEEEGDDRDDD